MTCDEAADLTAAVWESREPNVIKWLTRHRGFTRKGAVAAYKVFIETMVFVAEQTGAPQLGHQKAR